MLKLNMVRQVKRRKVSGKNLFNFFTSLPHVLLYNQLKIFFIIFLTAFQMYFRFAYNSYPLINKGFGMVFA